MAGATTSRPESIGMIAARFFLACIGLIAALCVVGYVPTTRIGGPEASVGLFAGCSVSLVGSWIGSVPVFLALKSGGGAAQSALASMAVRFVVVGGLAVAIALTDLVPTESFLIWVAISYVVLLVADVMLALRCSSATIKKNGKRITEVHDAGIE